MLRRVLTTVSTDEKAQIAREAGADEIIKYTETDFAEEVKRLTDDIGVEAVYDSVGKTTWERSLSCLKPLGHLIVFGNASGPVPAIDPLKLCSAGSISMTRPTLRHYVATREALLQRTNEIYAWISQGKVRLYWSSHAIAFDLITPLIMQLRVRIGKKLAVSEAAKAQDLLTGRQTFGKLILIP